MILVCVFSQYPAETFAVAEVKALRAQGIDVRPIALRWGRERLRCALEIFGLDDDTVTVFPLRSTRVWTCLLKFLLLHPVWLLQQLALLLWENCWAPKHLLKSLFVFTKGPALAEFTNALNADAVHIFWGHYPSLLIPFLKHLAPQRPISVFLGAYAIVAPVPSQGRVLQDADCLTTHFEGHMETLRKPRPLPKRPSAMVYRGVDLENIERFRVHRGSLGAGDHELIGVASRLVYDKAVDHALRAFALVSDRRPWLNLEVIGSGEEEVALRKLAANLNLSERMTFAGQLSHEETLAAVARYSVLVMPSLSVNEFYPNIMKEAMALRVPCVAYDLPGIRAFSISGGEVCLVKPGRIEQLAQRIFDILEDEDLRSQTVQAGWVRVQDFDIRKTAHRQAELFRALANRQVLPGWVSEV